MHPLIGPLGASVHRGQFRFLGIALSSIRARVSPHVIGDLALKQVDDRLIDGHGDLGFRWSSLDLSKQTRRNQQG
jgi:hypothetical protein